MHSPGEMIFEVEVLGSGRQVHELKVAPVCSDPCGTSQQVPQRVPQRVPQTSRVSQSWLGIMLIWTT